MRLAAVLFFLSWLCGVASFISGMGALWYWAIYGMSSTIQVAWMVTVVVLAALAVLLNILSEEL